MGNLNCIHCLGHKPASEDVNVDGKHDHDSAIRHSLCFRRRRRTSKEGDGNYLSSIEIFDRRGRCSKKKDPKEDRERSNSCAACSIKVTPNDGDNGGEGNSGLTGENRSLLRPPFKPLETPSGALLEVEVTLIKVIYLPNHISCIYIYIYITTSQN